MRFLSVKWGAGKGQEFYDYRNDPEELHNRIGRSRYQHRIANMRSNAKAQCVPEPFGFNWK